MQRKRDGLVSGQKIRDASPQALHHFTQADQVSQLVEASEADRDLGFMARLMALCSLPRSNPGNQYQYKRVNGPYRLILSRTGEYKLPFGNLPRLLLAWVTTEAVRTKSRELVLGNSLSDFMRVLGVYSNSGRVYARLRNQMNRLFHSSVEFTQEHERGNRFVAGRVVDRGEFWWNPKSPDEPMLWQSKIRLGEDFFNEIIRYPVPLDMNTLQAFSSRLMPTSLPSGVGFHASRRKADPKASAIPTRNRSSSIRPTAAFFYPSSVGCATETAARSWAR